MGAGQYLISAFPNRVRPAGFQYTAVASSATAVNVCPIADALAPAPINKNCAVLLSCERIESADNRVADRTIAMNDNSLLDFNIKIPVSFQPSCRAGRLFHVFSRPTAFNAVAATGLTEFSLLPANLSSPFFHDPGIRKGQWKQPNRR